MRLIYFKQVWTLLKQEKLFSTIYLLGTALSVTVVMVLSIILYIKIANIYPETNRDRILYVKSAEVKYNNSRNRSFLSEHTVDLCFRQLQSAEAVAIRCYDWGEDHVVEVSGQEELVDVEVQYVDENWWKVFSFTFMDGAPFTAADCQSGILTVVITQSLAKKAFGTTEVTGKYFTVDYRPYRVAGVVRDVPSILQETYANVWMPYTLHPEYKEEFDDYGLLGLMEVFLLAPTSAQRDNVEKEAKENIRKYISSFNDIEFSIMGQPDRHYRLIYRDYHNQGGETRSWILTGLVFLIVILVPAVSLSGMIDSRMERRIAELGIRRAFGAPREVLLKQVLYENMFFTFMGGVLGLVFCYLFLYLGREMIYQWQSYLTLLPEEGADIIFSPEMFFNIPVFLITLLVCLILNVLSAIIPAWRAAHREIVYSLTSK